VLFTNARYATEASNRVSFGFSMFSGATIKGKAVCENMCMAGSSFSSVPNPVLNPYDKERVSGGSSSGNAVLVS